MVTDASGVADTSNKTTRIPNRTIGTHIIMLIVITILITTVITTSMMSGNEIWGNEGMSGTALTGNVVHGNGVHDEETSNSQNAEAAAQTDQGAAAEYGAPAEFTIIYPENITREQAEQELRSAREAYARLVEQELGTLLSDDVLADASESLKLGNTKRVIELAQYTTYIAEKKILLNDQLILIEQKEEEYTSDDIDTVKGEEIIENARDALMNDRLEEVSQLIAAAQKALDDSKKEKERQSRLTYLSKNFLLRHWWKILLTGAIITAIGWPAAKKTIARRRKKKIARLRTELDKIGDILKKLQKDCFIDKKITSDTYKKRAAHYEERIGELKRTIPILEAQLHGKKKGKMDKEKKQEVKGILEVKR